MVPVAFNRLPLMQSTWIPIFLLFLRSDSTGDALRTFFLWFAKWLTERAIDTTVQLRLPLSVDNTNRFALQTATSLVWFTRLLFLQQSTLVNFNFVNFFHGFIFSSLSALPSARKNKCVFRYSHESLAFSLLKPFFPTLFQHICTSRSAATSSLWNATWRKLETETIVFNFLVSMHSVPNGLLPFTFFAPLQTAWKFNAFFILRSRLEFYFLNFWFVSWTPQHDRAFCFSSSWCLL